MNDEQRLKAVKSLVAKGDQAKDKAEQYYASAGCHLKELKEWHSKAEWAELIKTKCNLGVSRAYELIQIANGRKTVSDIRLSANERKQKHRAARPFRNGQNLPAKVEAVKVEDDDEYVDSREASVSKGQNLPAEVEHEEPVPDVAADGLDDKTEYDDDQAIWRRGLLYRARNAHGDAMFEDWSQYKVDDEVFAAVKQAALSWQKLVGYLELLQSEAAATAGTGESEAAPCPPNSADRRPAVAEQDSAKDDQDADQADPVPCKRKKSKLEEIDLGDAINTAFEELAELAGECREVVDSAPAGISETQRIQTLDETASVLEELEGPIVPDELAGIRVSFPTRKARSRAARRDVALSNIETCMDALSEIDESDPRRKAASDLCDELSGAVSLAENCEFPGMFG
jgi:hypothetical protein